MTEEIHHCEICNERAIIGLQDRWYCPAHIDDGMKLLVEPVKKAIRAAQRDRQGQEAKGE